MTARQYQVLFICTGNSARSILAEATLNHLGAGRFIAYSAGSRPTGRVNPLALQQLAANAIPVDGLRSKSWHEFGGAAAPPIDIVVTVCDNAAQATCPVYLGDVMRTHWGLSDPAAVTGSAQEIQAAFATTQRIVAHRVKKLLALPIDTMGTKTLREQLDTIGKSLP